MTIDFGRARDFCMTNTPGAHHGRMYALPRGSQAPRCILAFSLWVIRRTSNKDAEE